MLRASRFKYFAIAAVLTGVMSATPARALAQTSAADNARATQLFKSGKASFVKGDFAEAERSFADAFALRKSADIAANLALSELEQQKFRSAAEHFQWALTNLLPSATDAQRKAVETGLARARAEVGALHLEVRPDGSDVLVGAQSVGKSPIAASVFVDPGEVIISVKHEGFVGIDKRVLAAKGSEQSVEISLTPREPAGAAPSGAEPVDSGLERSQPRAARAADPTSGNTEPSSDHPSSARKTLLFAFVGTGVAVAGGVTGLVLTLTANSKEDKADTHLKTANAAGGCGVGGGASPSDCDRLLDERKSVDRLRNFAVGAFVVGGVAAIAAGYFYWDALSHRHREGRAPATPRYAFSPSIDLGGGSPGDRAASVRSLQLNFSGNF
jgi:hypothetical protein